MTFLSTKTIFNFLKQIAAHNNRDWFAANKPAYQEAQKQFDEIVQRLIDGIAQFEPEAARLDVKDCTYRIYRDIRFSPDKAPYKRHFGAFINPHGKKSLHGGYYFHLQPDASLLAGGIWRLPTPLMRAVRQAIVDEIDEFREIVENKAFKQTFPTIGEEQLKTVPRGFSKDFPYPSYLRAKDFNVVTYLDDNFFNQNDWLDQTIHIFKLIKPYNDFLNYTVDEYER